MVDIDQAVIARYKRDNDVFEILVDCEKALALRKGESISLTDVLASEEVFSDAKKGLLASMANIQNVFGTTDNDEIVKQIIKKGEIQVTSQYKSNQRAQKKNQILELLHRNGIDPRTMLPHPITRIELAFDEARVRIDEHRSAEEQVDRILKELRPILPIRVEERELAIRIPPEFAGKAYSMVKGFGRLSKDEWLTDGSWSGVIKIPAGMQADLFDKLNSVTHGNVETKVIGEK